MQKKLLYLFLIGAGMGILIWVFMPASPAPSASLYTSDIQESSSSASSIVIKKKQPSSSKKKHLLYKEKKVKYYTRDLSGKYEIALIDANPEDENVTITSGYRTVEGLLDGKKFILKIPKKSLEIGDLKLVVIDSRSNKKKEIDANFLKELDTLSLSQQYNLQLTFDNLSNYRTDIQEKRSLLPTPVQ